MQVGRVVLFTLTRRRKPHRFQMGLLRIQFNIHIEQRQRSKEKSVLRSLSATVNEPLQ